jgi:hypothetical protein
MDSREAFEKWAASKMKNFAGGIDLSLVSPSGHNGWTYATKAAESSWRAWQASRQALEGESRPSIGQRKAAQVGKTIGVLVQRDDGEVCAVTDMGRCTWLSEDVTGAGDGASVPDAEYTRALQDAFDRLQAQVAELYSALDNVNERLADGCRLSGDEVDDVEAALLNTGSEAFILRKQAEAVDRLIDASEISLWYNRVFVKVDCIRSVSQHLRNKANNQEQKS